MTRRVTMIPAGGSIGRRSVPEQKMIRVAAYCRVSTEQEEQIGSFENQVAYYTEYINHNPNFELAGIYTDEGISGTGTKKRVGFQRMIKDCEEGKIDHVITKSISRFARNTQDCLQYSRKLKNLGIGITFEKENIVTTEASGELLFTILSSLAQEESRNISENSRWGIRHLMSQGIAHINTTGFMGYDKGSDGKLIINKDQAKLVKRIFRMFEEGYGVNRIAMVLNEEGIPGVHGEPKWAGSIIEAMLKNEKYYGSMLLQKWYTEDYLTKRLRRNKGEVDQYYVENSHPAIIPRDEWDAVQMEFVRQQEFREKHKLKKVGKKGAQCAYLSKVFCGKCGRTLGRRAWKSRGVSYWICMNAEKRGGYTCSAEKIKEEKIHKAFQIAWNSIVQHREEYVSIWEDKVRNGDPLQRLRARQMIELTAEGEITCEIEELSRMVLEEMIIHDTHHITVEFLDGSVKEVVV